MTIEDRKIIVNAILSAINNGVQIHRGVLDGNGLYPEMWIELSPDLSGYFNEKYIQEEYISVWIHIEYHGLADPDCSIYIELVGDGNTEGVGTETEIPKKSAKIIIDYFEANNN